MKQFGVKILAKAEPIMSVLVYSFWDTSNVTAALILFFFFFSKPHPYSNINLSQTSALNDKMSATQNAFLSQL